MHHQSKDQVHQVEPFFDDADRMLPEVLEEALHLYPLPAGNIHNSQDQVSDYIPSYFVSPGAPQQVQSYFSSDTLNLLHFHQAVRHVQDSLPENV